jgi:hypothetical protein
LNLRSDGEFELWLNEEGRDLLVRELQALNEKNDHFHLMPKDWGGGEIDLSIKAYRETDRIVSSGKVLFRTDDWDQTHFPHVMIEIE